MPIDEVSPTKNVSTVNAVDSVRILKTENDRQRHENQKQKSPGKKVRDYFHPLKKAIEATNKRLEEQNLPYRFKVFKRWGDVFIEMYVLDETGKVKEKQRKNVSHDDFNRIIDDVVSIEGLFFDQKA